MVVVVYEANNEKGEARRGQSGRYDVQLDFFRDATAVAVMGRR